MNRKNWLEWVTLTISSIVVVSTFGYLIWLAMGSNDQEARLSVSVGEISRSGDHYAVALIVRNDGDKTAENVQVDVTLETPEGETEKAELMIPYLPYHSERQGTAIFGVDPRRGELTTSARAYQKP